MSADFLFRTLNCRQRAHIQTFYSLYKQDEKSIRKFLIWLHETIIHIHFLFNTFFYEFSYKQSRRRNDYIL